MHTWELFNPTSHTNLVILKYTIKPFTLATVLFVNYSFFFLCYFYENFQFSSPLSFFHLVYSLETAPFLPLSLSLLQKAFPIFPIQSSSPHSILPETSPRTPHRTFCYLDPKTPLFLHPLQRPYLFPFPFSIPPSGPLIPSFAFDMRMPPQHKKGHPFRGGPKCICSFIREFTSSQPCQSPCRG